jgi:hypothetical protein
VKRGNVRGILDESNYKTNERNTRSRLSTRGRADTANPALSRELPPNAPLASTSSEAAQRPVREVRALAILRPRRRSHGVTGTERTQSEDCSMNVATTIPTTDRAAEIMAQLRDSRRELENPKLFLITRRTIADRIARLERELASLAANGNTQH